MAAKRFWKILIDSLYDFPGHILKKLWKPLPARFRHIFRNGPHSQHLSFTNCIVSSIESLCSSRKPWSFLHLEKVSTQNFSFSFSHYCGLIFFTEYSLPEFVLQWKNSIKIFNENYANLGSDENLLCIALQRSLHIFSSWHMHYSQLYKLHELKIQYSKRYSFAFSTFYCIRKNLYIVHVA